MEVLVSRSLFLGTKFRKIDKHFEMCLGRIHKEQLSSAVYISAHLYPTSSSPLYFSYSSLSSPLHCLQVIGHYSFSGGQLSNRYFSLDSHTVVHHFC